MLHACITTIILLIDWMPIPQKILFTMHLPCISSSLIHAIYHEQYILLNWSIWEMWLLLHSWFMFELSCHKYSLYKLQSQSVSKNVTTRQSASRHCMRSARPKASCRQMERRFQQEVVELKGWSKSRLAHEQHSHDVLLNFDRSF